MKTLNLEIADTNILRSYGMMDRHSLGSDDGMLFVFPHKRKQSFWMQNTYLPLDIAFVDDDGVIFQISSMSPMNTRFTSSSEPCRYAVEVNKGWFKENDIGIGYKMFDGKDGITQARRSSQIRLSGNPSRQRRFAQVAINEEAPPIFEESNMEGELTPEQEQIINEEQVLTPQQEQMYSQPMQPNQKVEYNMNQTTKIKYAEQNNKDMDIVYWTLSGRVLPPRRLKPVPNEGYPIKNGPNGQYFTAFDSSPSIQGSGWEIAGLTPKNFSINNIISLEIVSEQGETGAEEEQTIEQPQNLWDRLKQKIFNG